MIAKFKKGDVVMIIPNDRYCPEIQAQSGMKQVIERVTTKSWGFGYILRGINKDGIPFICPESALLPCEQQLSFPGF